MTLYRCDKCIITVSQGSSIIQCLFVCVCVCVFKKGEGTMCQGQETYGGRQSEAVSRVQPGHVSTVMEDIFYTWTLNTSLSDVLSVDVTLLQCVWECVCVCARVCACMCVCIPLVCMAKERRILKMISVAHKLMFSWAREEEASASLAERTLSCSRLGCQSHSVYKFTVLADFQWSSEEMLFIFGFKRCQIQYNRQQH